MSKIGRKPINVAGVNVTVNGQEIIYKGAHASGAHQLPSELVVSLHDDTLVLGLARKKRGVNAVWGLHRALLANEINGARDLFEENVKIVGLGYKALVAGSKVTFSLGFSHKIDFQLPSGVTMETDKTGQNIKLKSADKALVGHVCSMIKALRPVEPYKGTGVMRVRDVVLRKAGKTKSS